MSNQITEKYFNTLNTLPRNIIISNVLNKTKFEPQKEIFRGRIYDKDKVGSIILKGLWQNKPAVLKIQILKLEFDEYYLLKKFRKQNKSKIIRSLKVYKHQKWNSDDGYGYLIMEFADGKPIYEYPMAKPSEIKEYCQFYEELKTKSITNPFFPPSEIEKSSLIFTIQRVSHWTNIAYSKNTLTDFKKKKLEEFYNIAIKHLPSIKMQFQHGHLSYSDIIKTNDKKYALMSNLFWSYRPEYYDSAFHLWACIKGIKDLKAIPAQVIGYINQWVNEYNKIPFISRDKDFERKFRFMLLERCIGAFLVDLENQELPKPREKHLKHLSNIFEEIFFACYKKLK